MKARAIMAALVLLGSAACQDDGVEAGSPSSSSGGSSTTEGADGAGTGEPVIEPPPGSLLDDPLQPLPEWLSAVGLYVTLPERDVVPDVALPYEPVWPLWSNGSDKQRFLVVPAGEVVDNTVQPWEFPAGTLLFKTFSYDDGPVETRLLRRAASGEWDYAVYQWLDDASDARLVDITLPIALEVPAGPHTIPAKLDCRSCHESAPSVVLGLDELQLAPSLASLEQRGVLAAPASPAVIEHEDETTRQILGWLHGDCVHCHNGLDGPSSSFDLRAAVALDNLVGVESQDSGSAGGIRVVPGDPGSSLMFLAISGEGDDPEIKDMPPVGVDVRDAASIERVRGWIEGLP